MIVSVWLQIFTKQRLMDHMWMGGERGN